MVSDTFDLREGRFALGAWPRGFIGDIYDTLMSLINSWISKSVISHRLEICNFLLVHIYQCSGSCTLYKYCEHNFQGACMYAG